jgi:hypothetical protein
MGLQIIFSADGYTTVPSNVLTALNTAAEFFEQQFTNNITVNIAVGWGEINGDYTSLTPGSGTGGEAEIEVVPVI